MRDLADNGKELPSHVLNSFYWHVLLHMLRDMSDVLVSAFSTGHEPFI